DGQSLNLDVVNVYVADVIALVVRLGIKWSGEQVPASRYREHAVSELQARPGVAGADDDAARLLRSVQQMQDQSPVIRYTVPIDLGTYVGGGDPNIAQLLARQGHPHVVHLRLTSQ